MLFGESRSQRYLGKQTRECGLGCVVCQWCASQPSLGASRDMPPAGWYLVPCTVSGLVGGWSLIRAVTICGLAPSSGSNSHSPWASPTWRLLVIYAYKIMNQSAFHVLICTHYLWQCIFLMQCAMFGKLQVFLCFSFHLLQLGHIYRAKLQVHLLVLKWPVRHSSSRSVISASCQIFIRASSRRRFPRSRRVFASNLSALVVLNRITEFRLQSTPRLPTRFA